MSRIQACSEIYLWKKPDEPDPGVLVGDELVEPVVAAGTLPVQVLRDTVPEVARILNPTIEHI